MRRLPKFILCLCVLPALASAQVFRCAGAGGVRFSDKPCEAGQKSSEMKAYAAPVVQAPTTAPRMSAEAVAHENERQRKRAQSDESHRRIDEASASVRKIRRDNADPEKCQAARKRLALMARKDALLVNLNPDYMDAAQKESLYCGN